MSNKIFHPPPHVWMPNLKPVPSVGIKKRRHKSRAGRLKRVKP